MAVSPNVHYDLVVPRTQTYASIMGGTRDFSSEYLRLAADRMLALAQAFHGWEATRRVQPKVRTVRTSSHGAQRRAKVGAQA